MVEPSRRIAIKSALSLVMAANLAAASGPQVERPAVPRKLRPRVMDEFGPLEVAIVHDAENVIDLSRDHIEEGIDAATLKDHPESGPVVRKRVLEQHSEMLEALAHLGVKFLHPSSVDRAHSQIFTRDPSFVVGERFFVAALRDAFRISEVAGLGPIRNQLESTHDLVSDEVDIEGGDIIVLEGGEIVLAGTHRHTNEAGLHALKAQVEPTGARVIAVPHRALHLDCVLAPLPNGDVLVNPHRISEKAFGQVRPLFKQVHLLDRHEALKYLAANVFWVDPETVFSSVTAPRTNKLLRSLGFRVETFEYSQIIAMWGSFRCVVCPVVRA